MRTSVKILTVLVVGSALGLGATYVTAVHASLPGGVCDGVWHTNLSIGSSSGSPYTRARVALHGLLALNRSETMYYTATTDAAGDPLDGACTYKLKGRILDARWWSITAYGADDYLIPGTDGHYSFSLNDVRNNAGTNYTVKISAKESGRYWIAVKPGRFSLTLRLYNPDAPVVADPAHADLPSLTKESCA